MSPNSIHISCSRLAMSARTAFMYAAQWSETLEAPGTTDNKAEDDYLLLVMKPNVNCFVAVGPEPDASLRVGRAQTARQFIAAYDTCEILCKKGDKVAWVLA